MRSLRSRPGRSRACPRCGCRDVITSTPAAKSEAAVDRGQAHAAGQVLAVGRDEVDAPGRRAGPAAAPRRPTRPGLPIMSPIIRTRQAPFGRGALPFVGLPRIVRPAAIAARPAGRWVPVSSATGYWTHRRRRGRLPRTSETVPSSRAGKSSSWGDRHRTAHSRWGMEPSAGWANNATSATPRQAKRQTMTHGSSRPKIGPPEARWVAS